MSVWGYKERLKRMRKHVSCLQSRANHLLREQDSKRQHVTVLEGLVHNRDAWAAALRALGPQAGHAGSEQQASSQQHDCTSSQQQQQQLADGRHRQEGMPLAGFFTRIDRAMHEEIISYTPAQARTKCLSYVQDLETLLALHDLDACLAEHALADYVELVLAWICMLYYFNCTVASKLHNVNLVTGQPSPPPAGHWRGVFQAIHFTTEQLQQVNTATMFLTPRLQQLQQQQQALLQQLAELEQASMTGSAEEQDTLTFPAAAAATLQYATAAAAERLPVFGKLDINQFLDAAAAVAAALATSASCGSFTSGSSAGSGSSSNSSSNRERQQQMAQAEELVRKLEENCHAWRLLVGLRAQYTLAILTPVQAARAFVACAPYLLIGAPIFDEAMASSQK